ncbi:Cna B-type domain-containing protein [Mogibacterium diversum]|uniref:Cna B-type domain-containing protein n=1 Tax=Mogibacterium diversum TaxID=114527 RepID=UPI0026F3003C|nr:Cna B-type domain-containing protein [Mogibacterium diversum]
MNSRGLKRVMAVLFSFVLFMVAGISVYAATNETQPATSSTAGVVATAGSGVANGVSPGVSNEKIDIPLKVEWTGRDRVPVDVTLWANGVRKQTVYLDYQKHWEHTFRNMPKYDENGDEIKYTVTQPNITTYGSFKYKTTISGDAATGFVIKNFSMIDITVGKSWNMIPNIVIPGTPSPAAPPTMFFVTNVLSAFDDAMSYSLDTSLAADSNTEDENYDDPVNSSDDGEQPDDRSKSKVAVPDSITVKLLADGRVVDTMQLTKDMDWTGKFENLPRYDERDNHEIQYTIEETPVLGYKTEYLHTSVIDVVINKSIIDIPVEKKWVGKKSGPVEVKLYRTCKVTKYDYNLNRNVTTTIDEEVDSAVLNDSNNWKHTFKDMYEFYIEDGENPVIYKYYVKEVNVAGYDTDITGDQNEGFIITNTSTDKISIPVEKKWVGEAADSAKVKLFADGSEVGEVELNEANNWKHVFANLQKYNNSNKEIKYTVKEVGEDGNLIKFGGKSYKVIYKGNAEDGFTVTNEKENPPSTTTPAPKKPSVPKKHISPRTGDDSHLALYTLMLGTAASALGLLGYRRGKKAN